MSKAAPDVDLKRQTWVSNHFVVAGVAVACTVCLYKFSSFSQGEQPEELEETAWARWGGWIFVRVLQVLLGGCLAIFVLVLSVLILQQRSILYVPATPGTVRSTRENPMIYRSPEAWGLPYEDVMIPTADGVRVHAWLIYHPKSTCKEHEVPFTFIYFHGNAGNMGHRLENIRDMHHKLKANVLIVDYRGYGDSEDGRGPSQAGFMMDAMATYSWLIDSIRSQSVPAKFREDRILLFGRSIGGAVAIRLMADLLRESLAKGPAALPVPAGLVLENTFTTLADMAVELFPFLSFLRVLLRPPIVFDDWNSKDSMRYLTKNHQQWSCCLFSGLQDQIVPPSQMRQLHGILTERRPRVLKYFCFPDGGHNDTPNRGGAEYWGSFMKFLAQVVANEDRADKDD